MSLKGEMSVMEDIPVKEDIPLIPSDEKPERVPTFQEKFAFFWFGLSSMILLIMVVSTLAAFDSEIVSSMMLMIRR